MLSSRAEAQVRVVVGKDAAVSAGGLGLTIDGSLDVEGAFNPQGAEISFSNPDGGVLLTHGLAAEIRSSGDFDALDVAGSVTLGGTLTVSLAPDAAVHQGDLFTLLTCSSCTGTFDEVFLPGGFDLAYENQAVTVTATTVPTGIETPTAGLVTTLQPASPNPAHSRVSIPFDIATPADISLAVYDLLGRRVALLAQGFHSTGRYQVAWNTGNLPNGLYLIQLMTGTTRHTYKVLVRR